ncbi:hypothetical protein BOTBODRAFT_394125 [Botryobasidium botryosum FD-172 SS1]|uniref:CNH domain-containing protein n=1 Tax=Botryobasidium botryosum (strain FD-172 SS1) TaxID=930990 RepID=A0A067N8C5_BOTB1|nr:hypothetical protein BOTBODRAFT_394125 [Botryobasidium botryosum FD-172 SS1]
MTKIVEHVGISDNYVLFCLLQGLLAYSRQTGAVVLDLCSRPCSLFGRSLSRALQLETASSSTAPVTASSKSISCSLVPLPNIKVFSALFNAAVHISPCGRDLVTVTMYGLLVYIRDFAEPQDLEDRIHLLYMRSKVMGVAYDGNRIAVCMERDLYCITLNNSRSASLPLLPPTATAHHFPSSSIQRIGFPPNEFSFAGESCLELTPTSLWFSTYGDISTRGIYYVNFSK